MPLIGLDAHIKRLEGIIQKRIDDIHHANIGSGAWDDTFIERIEKIASLLQTLLLLESALEDVSAPTPSDPTRRYRNLDTRV